MLARKVIVAVRDPATRDRLLGVLGHDFGSDAVVTTTSGLELAKLLDQRRPAILFVCADLDGASIWQIIEGFTPRRIPLTVFVAPDGLASKDIDATGWGRIAPTAQAPEIVAAIERAKKFIRSAATHASLGSLARARLDAQGRIDQICVRFGIRPRFIPLSSVNWIESCGNYVRLHTADPEPWKVRITLVRLEKLLDPQQFIRVHRCHIVNADHVMAVIPHLHGDAKVQLRNGTTVELSRTHRAALEALDVTAG